MSLSTFGLFVVPRLGLAAIWLLTDRVDDAFEKVVWPALGLAFTPSATILYILLYTEDVGDPGVGGLEWLFVGLGAAVDAAIWVTRLLPERKV